jgi:deoxycytidylate deaminase
MENKNQKEIKYPYLPEGKNILHVGMDNVFMVAAKEAARLSNDQQQPTGAVIVCDNKIVSSFSNKNPLTSSFLIKLHKKYCIRHMLKIPSGQKYWVCPGCAKNESHAESRAVKDFIKNKISCIKPDLYLWGHWWCCDVCWNNMLKLPINNVYLLEDSEILFNAKNSNNILGKQFE